jgi:small-conductance mechanosensitive channel
VTPDPVSITAAVGLAAIAAYIVADVVARLAQAALHAILTDQHIDSTLVVPTLRIIRVVVFLVTGVALVLPALRYVGVQHITAGYSPEALAKWAMESGLRIAVIAVAAYTAMRLGSAAARRFEHEMSTGTGLDVLERTKRARTLSALIQRTLSAAVVSIAALMILRELDVDITPVLTGAGIVGLAVGFGAQTLVRDIISGFFLILEDQARVGDVAIVNGQGGLIEAVNLRTIVLRDEEGTVHVFPNGEIKTLANRSKDFSYFVFNLALPFDADPDDVGATLREIATTLAEDEQFRPHILAPFELYGVDAIEPGQFKLKGRIKTVPLKQWLVGREFLGRVTKALRARGIDVSKPTLRVYVETPITLKTSESDRTLEALPARSQD